MATRQQLHLDILDQEYGRFVKDQVLTDVQLNEIIDFFEDQHRLTRTCLIGTGIVCGLQMTSNSSSVTLAPGVAVTTDGDLLKPAGSTYLYFTKYVPPQENQYDPFYFQSGSTEKMLNLFQLLTEEEKDELNSDDFQPISKLDDTITNWVAILFLEYYTKDPQKCTPTNCDNLGIRQKATLKLLILSKDDMDKLIHKDTGEIIGDDIYLKYHSAYDQYFTFPVIKAKRVVAKGVTTLKSTTLASAYFTAAKSGASNLSETIKKMYKAYGFLLDKNGTINIDALTTHLTKILTQPTNTLHAQYTYDFYKDVVATYNEIRESLSTITFECCPNIYAFPKHIMVGEPNIEYGPQPPEYRHQFYPSPAVSDNRELANHAASLLARLKLLIDNFKPEPTIKIRITPSLDYNDLLSNRAIPFYYDNIDQMAQEWSYTKNLRGQEKNNLSYNSDQYTAPIPEETLNPFEYDIDPHTFFRIEGHIGRTFQEPLKELNELRAASSVPFDIVAVRLGDVKLSDIDLDDFSCQFEDLNTILRAFQAEISCLLSEGATFFSGFTAIAAEPHINMHLFKAQSEQQKWAISDDQLKKINILNLAADVGMKAKVDDQNFFTEALSESFPDRTFNISKTPAGKSLSEMLTGKGKFVLQRDPCDQFNTPLFSSKRIVKTKLNLNQKAFGKYFLQALESETDSVDTFVEKARNIAVAADAIKDLNEDERYVVFEYPMQIIGNLNYMQRFVPGSLAAINTNLITSYHNFSQIFCKRLKAMHTRLENYFKKTDYTSRGFETAYLSMLNNLSKLCCANEKLEVIMEEIEKRKAAILEKLSFARYAEQHPGLEHKCGTHRGGTFVMVYAGKKSSPKKQILSELHDASSTTDLKKRAMAIAGSPYRDPDVFALYVAGNDKTVDTEAELTNFLKYNKVRPGTVAAESLINELNLKIASIRQILCRNLTEPEQDIVIADFCLPYLCCSDCPPMAFVIPRERKILALPEDTVCSTSGPIAFSLYSPKGSVIGSPEAPKAITQGEKPTFNPAMVPSDQIGKTITFTLDGEATSCEIVVRQPLSIELLAELENINDDIFMVIYSNKTDESSIGPNSYSWAFNDGSSEATRGNDQLLKRFSRSVLAEKGIDTITADVKVLDDPCDSTGKVNIDIPPRQVNTCKDQLLSFISGATKTLTSQTFKRRVEATDRREIFIIYEETVKTLDGSKNAVTNDDANLKDRLLQTFKGAHDRIYGLDLPRTTRQDHRRILEELLRTQIMLMLNLVRCDKDLAGVNRGVIVDRLGMFIELQRRVKTKYPQLDSGNVLEKEVREYNANFVSQEVSIKRMLKQMIEVLATFV